MSFDKTKAYAAQEEDVYFNDGREVALLHFVYSRPNIAELRGSPEKVLEAIDEYGHKEKYLMNVGEDKGRVVTELINKHKPKFMLELGGYVGYSSIYFGAAFKRNGGEKYIVLEKSPEFAAVTASLLDLAGLSDITKVVVGSSDDSIRRLNKEGILTKQIDMLFLDHIKPAYLPDLKLLEQLGLIGKGSILAADNVIKPGNPPYLEYVNASVEKKKELQGRESQGLRGDPTLVYESEMIHSFEPTGVPDAIEITRCTGKES